VWLQRGQQHDDGEQHVSARRRGQRGRAHGGRPHPDHLRGPNRQRPPPGVPAVIRLVQETASRLRPARLQTLRLQQEPQPRAAKPQHDGRQGHHVSTPHASLDVILPCVAELSGCKARLSRDPA